MSEAQRRRDGFRNDLAIQHRRAVEGLAVRQDSFGGNSFNDFPTSSRSFITLFPAETTSLPGHSSSAPTSSQGQSSSATTSSQGHSSSAPTPNKPMKHISGGAIGGIVVGVLLIFAIGILGFFFIRKRRAAVDRNQPADGIPELGPGIPNSKNMQHFGGTHELGGNNEKTEMQTSAITHELPVGAGAGTRVGDKDIGTLPYHLVQGTYVPYNGGEYQEYPSTQYELSSDAVTPKLSSHPMSPAVLPAAAVGYPPKAQIAPLGSSQTSRTSQEDVIAGKSGSASGSKLDVLQQRMERIREEQERLRKMQELAKMEAAVQREILDEQKK